jgi:hypothetical protein
MIKPKLFLAFTLLLIGAMPAAHAQWAVVDVGAITAYPASADDARSAHDCA